MSCNRCNKNKRKIKSGIGIQVGNILEVLNNGLCKLTVKRIGENNPIEIYCTRQQEFVPSKGSSKYREKENVQSVMKKGFILVWVLDKTLNNEVEEKEAGWLKVKTDQIISYDFIGKIPIK
ncbi:MAG: hypothetical protein H8D80_01535 [Proteobacteria bacterium]|nr:hypothetical protein [Pseudomonadota bacterium]